MGDNKKTNTSSILACRGWFEVNQSFPKTYVQGLVNSLLCHLFFFCNLFFCYSISASSLFLLCLLPLTLCSQGARSQDARDCAEIQGLGLFPCWEDRVATPVKSHPCFTSWLCVTVVYCCAVRTLKKLCQIGDVLLCSLQLERGHMIMFPLAAIWLLVDI